MKPNFPANALPIQSFERTIEITSRMMAAPGRLAFFAAFGPEPALADMVFEQYADPPGLAAHGRKLVRTD